MTLLLEIIDHIIYFTKNKVTELCLVCKYFNQVCKKIRITSNEKYPNIKDENFAELSNLTTITTSRWDNSRKITNRGISLLFNLTDLNLSGNRKITIDGIKLLSNLVSLRLGYNSRVTDNCLIQLTKLTTLNLTDNDNITDKSIKLLTGLTSLNLTFNHNISDDGISQLTNLTSLVNCGRITYNCARRLPNLTSVSIYGKIIRLRNI